MKEELKMLSEHYEKLKELFKDDIDIDRSLLMQLYEEPRKGRKAIQNLILSEFNSDSYISDFYIERSLCAFDPSVCSKDPMMLEIWAKPGDRLKGEKRRTSGKPGKMFKKMFPFIEKNSIDRFAENFKEHFEEKELFIHETSMNRQAIVKVYTGPTGQYKSPTTSAMRKNLAQSCMRHSVTEFEDLNEDDPHPVEIYATEDFMLFYTTCVNGLVHSRSLVWTKHPDCPQVGPIYGVCEQSVQMLEDHLSQKGWNLKSPIWQGAKVLKLNSYNGEYYVGAYIDLAYSMDESDCGKYFILKSNEGEGTHEPYSDSGVIGLIQRYCYECAEGYNPEEMRTVNGDEICDYCFENSYFNCEECSEPAHNDYGYWVEHETQICESCFESMSYEYVENEGTFFKAEDVIETEQGERFLKVNTDDWFKSDLTGLYHSVSELVDLDCGTCATEDELIESTKFLINEDNEWKSVHEKEKAA